MGCVRLTDNCSHSYSRTTDNISKGFENPPADQTFLPSNFAPQYFTLDKIIARTGMPVGSALFRPGSHVRQIQSGEIQDRVVGYLLLEGMSQKVEEFNLPKKELGVLRESLDNLTVIGSSAEIDSKIWLKEIGRFQKGLRALGQLGAIQFLEPSPNRLDPIVHQASPLVEYVRKQIIEGLQPGKEDLLERGLKRLADLANYARHMEEKVTFAQFKRSLHHPIVKAGLDQDQLIYYCEVPEGIPEENLVNPEDPCFFDKTPRELLNQSPYVRTYFKILLEDSPWATALRAGEKALYSRAGGKVLFPDEVGPQSFQKIRLQMETEKTALQSARYEEFFNRLGEGTEETDRELLTQRQQTARVAGQEWQKYNELENWLRSMEDTVGPGDPREEEKLKEVWDLLVADSSKMQHQAAVIEKNVEDNSELLPYLKIFGDSEKILHPFGVTPDHPDYVHSEEGNLWSIPPETSDYYNQSEYVGSIPQNREEYERLKAEGEKDVPDPDCDFTQGGYFKEFRWKLRGIQARLEQGELNYKEAIEKILPAFQQVQKFHFKFQLALWLQTLKPEGAKDGGLKGIHVDISTPSPGESLENVLGRIHQVQIAFEKKKLTQAIQGQIEFLNQVQKEYQNARGEILAAEFETLTVEELLNSYKNLLKEVQEGNIEQAWPKFLRLSNGGPFQETARRLEGLQDFRMYKSLALDAAIIVASFGFATGAVAGVRGMAALRGLTVLRVGSLSELAAIGAFSYGFEQLLNPLKYKGEAPTKSGGEHFRDLIFHTLTLGVLAKGMSLFRNQAKNLILNRYAQRTGTQLLGAEGEVFFQRFLKETSLFQRGLYHAGMLGTEFAAFTGWSFVEGNLRLALDGKFAPGAVFEDVFSADNLLHQALFIAGMKLGNSLSRPIIQYSSKAALRLVLQPKQYSQWQSLQKRLKNAQGRMADYLEDVLMDPSRTNPVERQRLFTDYLLLAQERVKFMESLPEKIRNSDSLSQAREDLSGAMSLQQLEGAFSPPKGKTPALKLSEAKVLESTPEGLDNLRQLGAPLVEIEAGVYTLELSGERIVVRVRQFEPVDPYTLVAKRVPTPRRILTDLSRGGTTHGDPFFGAGIAYQTLEKIIRSYSYFKRLPPNEKVALQVAAFDLASLEGNLSKLGREVSKVEDVDPLRAYYFLSEKVGNYREFSQSPEGLAIDRARSGLHEKLKAMIRFQTKGVGAYVEPAFVPRHSGKNGVVFFGEIFEPPVVVVERFQSILAPRKEALMKEFELNTEAQWIDLLHKVIVQAGAAGRRSERGEGTYNLPASVKHRGIVATSLEDKNVVQGHFLTFLDDAKARTLSNRRFSGREIAKMQTKDFELILRAGRKLVVSLELIENRLPGWRNFNPDQVAGEIHAFRAAVAEVKNENYSPLESHTRTQVEVFVNFLLNKKFHTFADKTAMDSLGIYEDFKSAYELARQREQEAPASPAEGPLPSKDSKKNEGPGKASTARAKNSELREIQTSPNFPRKNSREHRKAVLEAERYFNDSATQLRVDGKPVMPGMEPLILKMARERVEMNRFSGKRIERADKPLPESLEAYFPEDPGKARSPAAPKPEVLFEEIPEGRLSKEDYPLTLAAGESYFGTQAPSKIALFRGSLMRTYKGEKAAQYWKWVKDDLARNKRPLGRIMMLDAEGNPVPYPSPLLEAYFSNKR